MAEVYTARVEGPDGFSKLVAIKLIAANLRHEHDFVAMFLDEARVAARLHHPNVVGVIDYGRERAAPFLVMEYVHGRDLRTLLRAGSQPSRLPVTVALTIIRDACLGLHHVHNARDEAGVPLHVVHRDVSPSNVMVRYDGVVKLVDFGVAKAATQAAVTGSGVLKGKLGYMSPEQCLGVDIDHRSDIFAIGITAFEALTSRRLFRGPNEAAILNRIISCDVPRPTSFDPEFPPLLEAVLLRALQRDPEARFPSALAMAEAIEAAIESLGARCSNDAVANHMHLVFGDVPLPSVEPVTRPEPRDDVTIVESEPRATPRRGARRQLVFAVAGAMGLGAMATALALPRQASVTTASDVPDVSRALETGDRGTTGAVVPGPALPIVAPVVLPSSAPSPPATTANEQRVAPPRRERWQTGKRRVVQPASVATDAPPQKPPPGTSPDSMMPR